MLYILVLLTLLGLGACEGDSASYSGKSPRKVITECAHRPITIQLPAIVINIGFQLKPFSIFVVPHKMYTTQGHGIASVI